MHFEVPVHRIAGERTKKCGLIGNMASHISAIELAKKYEYQTVLIMEDDFMVKHEF